MDRETKEALTPAAEEYLEMIYRLSSWDDCAEDGLTSGERPVRICSLAEELHVSPSSASRMAQSMALWGYIDFRRYGYITLTEKGREKGEYLLRRRKAVRLFFDRLCGGECPDNTDRISHFLSAVTVEAIERKNVRQSQKKTDDASKGEKNTKDSKDIGDTKDTKNTKETNEKKKTEKSLSEPESE